MDLSILIPSRCEMFLSRTIQDILQNIRGNTEIIAVLDGEWADPPIPQHELVTVVYLNESIGQRAASNLAAKLSKAKYVMKVDAHCAFDEGFDVKLMADMQDDWTVVPTMRNLHVFDLVCENGHRRYQGPSGPCLECGKPTVIDIVWIAKKNPQSNSYCFDAEPHFQYNGEYTKRKEYQDSLRDTGLTETMSLQGSCFMLTRDKYFELNICDESFGSWGSQGIEVSAKTWLSGGKVMVNHNTWYSHCFRTSGGDFGFPYHLSGKQVSHAKTSARELFFNGRWPLMIRPLSWLVERFWPIRGWSQDDLTRLKDLESVSKFTTLITTSPASDRVGRSESVSPLAESFLSIEGGRGGGSHNIDSGQDQNQMGRITADSIMTNMVEDRNILALPFGDRLDKPSIDKTMNIQSLVAITSPSISSVISRPHPQPATSIAVELDSGKQISSLVGADVIDNKHIVHVGIIRPVDKKVKTGIVYYTDNRLDSRIDEAVKAQLVKTGTDIVSVSLSPILLGRNIVLNYERGYLTLFKQILAGLEASTADVIFFAEHDCLYHQSHFDFVPPDGDKVWYNLNLWAIRADDGHVVYYDAKRTSQLCAYRDVLIEHYRKRVTRVEKEGFSRRIGFEPGSHGRSERIDDLQSDTWKSALPNIDIKHGKNLTEARWSQSQFRDKRNCQNWKEGHAVEGWGVTKDRFWEFLEEVK